MEPLHEPIIQACVRAHVNAEYATAIGRDEELNPAVIGRIAIEAFRMTHSIERAKVIDLRKTRDFRKLIRCIHGE